MSPLSELQALPVSERLQLVEDLWDSIAKDQHLLPDHPSIVAELRARKAEYLASPNSAIPWEVAKEQIRSGRV